MTTFKIDIVSDTVCPWCYVGSKRLQKGISAYKEKHPDSGDVFETNWLPFYLNPEAPRVGVDKQEMYKKKFGADRADIIFQSLSDVGKTEGIDFSFGGKTGNTRNSHRLIAFAKSKSPEMQTKMVHALFRAYFENEKDITSNDTLTEAAVEVGLDKDEVSKVLESDQFGKDVDQEVLHAQESMVSGVPYFTIQDRFEVSGAQEPDKFLSVFEKVKQFEVAGKA